MVCTIEEAKNEVRNGARAYYKALEDKNGRFPDTAMLPFFLVSAPGVGKTEITKQVAGELGVGFISCCITHYTRTNAFGLPVIRELSEEEKAVLGDRSGKYTENSMSEIIAGPVRACLEGQEKGILLLDEFNCISDTLLPVALSLLQTRTVGTYTLPRGWILVLCGNPVSFNKSAKAFSAAILDRVRRIDIEPDTETFLAYAEQNGVHPIVLRYLREYSQNAYRINGKGEEPETVTFRSWENLSYTLYGYENLGQNITQITVDQFIKATDIAEDFYRFYQTHRDGFGYPEAEAVLRGERTAELVKLLSEKDYLFRMNALKIIENTLAGAYREAARTGEWAEDMERLSEYVNRAFRFIRRLPDRDTLCENLMYGIAEDPDLLPIVEKVGCEEYLKVCRKAYGITRKGA
ncbi:MAG: AAA family ATPase [Lachnospiraceae bacterium]|nr:AAA family ATPase [Lachnospiraceae bacterium]